MSTLGVAACLFAGETISAEPMQREIVVTASKRLSDAALAAEVAAALRKDPYIFSDHVSVTAKDGVVKVGGLVNDVSDLLSILILARRIAGKGRVVDEIQFDPVDDDGNQSRHMSRNISR